MSISELHPNPATSRAAEAAARFEPQLTALGSQPPTAGYASVGLNFPNADDARMAVEVLKPRLGDVPLHVRSGGEIITDGGLQFPYQLADFIARMPDTSARLGSADDGTPNILVTGATDEAYAAATALLTTNIGPLTVAVSRGEHTA